MKNFNEIAYSIRNQVKGYFSTDDERIDIELIYKMMANVRSLLIKEDYKLNKRVAEDYYQECPCLEIQCGKIECAGISIKSDTFYIELPDIEDVTGAIKYLGTADLAIPFTQKTYQGLIYNDGNKYTSNIPIYTTIDNKAILKNLPTPNMKYINLVAVFEDPNGCANKCYQNAEEMAYPTPNNIIHKLELICIKQLMSTLPVLPDERNNATDNYVQDDNQDRNGQRTAQPGRRRR